MDACQVLFEELDVRVLRRILDLMGLAKARMRLRAASRLGRCTGPPPPERFGTFIITYIVSENSLKFFEDH